MRSRACRRHSRRRRSRSGSAGCRPCRRRTGPPRPSVNAAVLRSAGLAFQAREQRRALDDLAAVSARTPCWSAHWPVSSVAQPGAGSVGCCVAVHAAGPGARQRQLGQARQRLVGHAAMPGVIGRAIDADEQHLAAATGSGLVGGGATGAASSSPLSPAGGSDPSIARRSIASSSSIAWFFPRQHTDVMADMVRPQGERSVKKEDSLIDGSGFLLQASKIPSAPLSFTARTRPCHQDPL